MSKAGPDISKLSLEDRIGLEKRLAARRGSRAKGQAIGPRANRAELPLSYAQERLWFLDQLVPGSPVYNICGALRMRGRLQRQVLQNSLEEIVRRHTPLRARFLEVEGKPIQRVEPPGSFPLPLTHLPAGEADPDHALEPLAKSEFLRPFDLAQDSPLRCRLVQMSESDHVLLITLHHISADAWSTGLFLRELGLCYEALAKGEPSPLAPLEIDYVDYAAWQRRWLDGERMERQLAYWKGKMEGSSGICQLPWDRPRPAVPTFQGGRLELELPGDLVASLKALARREDATLFMVLLAGFQTLLHKYSGQTDLVVASPAANRNRVETEGLIGFFANMLLLRADFSGQPTFVQLLGQVKQSALEAYAHQDVPFERLVESLQPHRELSYHPLFQVTFALQNVPWRGLRLPGLELERMNLAQGGAKFDLSFSLYENGQGLSGSMDYSRDLFERETIERLLRHYQTLLRAVAENPRSRLADLSLMEPEEEKRLARWHGQARDYPRDQSISERFEAMAEAHPDAVAVEQGENRLTYRELEGRANQVASFLKKAGTGSESLVGICMDRSVEMIMGILGILKAGGAYVPLDPEYPAERLKFMIEDTQLKVVLSNRRLAAEWGGVLEKARWIAMDGEKEAWAREPAQRENPGAGPESLAYVIYTSGSTGRPKGVAVTQRGVVRLVCRADYTDLGPETVCLQLAPVSFDASTLEIWGPLLNGGRCVLYVGEKVPSAQDLGAEIRRGGVNLLWLTASLYNSIIEENAEVLRPVNQLLIGGEALSVEHVKKGLEQLEETRIINGYGPTEGTTFTCCYRIPRDFSGERGSVPIGRPIGNTQVYVVDEGGKPVPPGVWGELWIGGDGLARGYWNRPDLTGEKFVESRWGRVYRTGDRCRWLEDGSVEFGGRWDGQVKVRGHRIELGEIETVLAGNPRVGECAVVVGENGAGEKVLVGYVVQEQHGKLTERGLREYLRERMPAYMVPGLWVFLEALPLNPNGKLDRNRLPACLDSGKAPGFVAPGTPVEEMLAGLWAEVLGVEAVGVRDDFFLKGGHSLLATRLVARLRKVFEIEFPLRLVFEAPVLEDMAACVEEARLKHAPKDRPGLAPCPREGALPLSFGQERLWFLDRAGQAPYNISGAWRLRGDLDIELLRGALEQIIQRHEILRCRFRDVQGEPQVMVAGQGRNLGWNEWDWTGRAGLEVEGRLGKLVSEELERPFDLEKGPLMRAVIIRLGPDQHVLTLALHHIVSDGWSMGVMFRELKEIYRASVRACPPDLRPLPLQYVDFAVWQRSWMTGSILEEGLSFWREALLDAPEVLSLPWDRPRPAEMSYDGGRVAFPLEKEVASAMRRLSREEGVTLYMTMLASFKLLLLKWSGQEDVVVGTGVAGRAHESLQDLIGFFINTVALRTDLAGDPDFREVMGRVKRTVLDSFAHDEVPFEKVVESLGGSRTPAHHPVFQVLFAWQGGMEAALDLEGVEGTALPIDRQTAKFDLMLTLVDRDDSLSGICEFNRELFDEITIRRLTDHYLVLLRSIAEGSERSASRLAWLTEEETTRLTGTWQGGRSDYPGRAGLAALFEETAKKHSDRVAAVFGGGTMSYGELNRQANRLAWTLRKKGVKAGDRVGLYGGRNLAMAVGVMGIIKAGAGYVPLDPSFPSGRIEYMLEDAGIQVLVLTEDTAGFLAGRSLELVSLLEGARESLAENEDNPDHQTDGESLAYVIYTSGSTGEPKGVCVPQRAVTRLVRNTDYVQISPEDVVAQASAVTFDAATFELWGAWLNGAKLVMIDKEVALSPKEFGDQLAEQGVSILFLTTALFNQMARERPAVFSGLKHLLFGGEQVDPRWVRRVLEQGRPGRLLHVYGPTEATTFATWHEVGEVENGTATVPIGRPLMNTEAYVLDRWHQPVPAGGIGELFIGGDALALGYLNRPELTRQKFVQHPWETGRRLYRTGDLVRWRQDGNLEFVGRRDGQVKIRGFRIELGEIEAALRELAALRECAVVVREDGAVEKMLVGYLVPAGGEQPKADALRQFLRTKLPEYMIPAAWVWMDELPLNRSGKIDRRRLPVPEPTRPASPTGSGAGDDLQGVISGIWGELLGVKEVGLEDNFFDLGGHSLMLVRVQSRLQEVLDRDVRIVDLFQYPTVKALAAHLGRSSAQAGPALVSAPRIREEDVAIIGMNGRFPGAPDVEALWSKLREGAELITHFSMEELEGEGLDPAILRRPGYVRSKGVIEGVGEFDAGFFGYSPMEAEIIDPQQRLFLECAWEALERAGYDPSRYPGNVGVFGGVTMNTYLGHLMSRPELVEKMGNFQLLLGSDKDFLAARISYKLNLKGPSVVVQTACSTSLVAVHLAAESLRRGECDMALAGGVSLTFPIKNGYQFREEGIVSPDGHCRTFDERAAGTVKGDGAGLVVLKLLSQARKDGDTIRALIRGSAINNDGSLKVGFTAPSVAGQAAVIRAAHQAAGVAPESIGYVEAHGTGTALGDPIEVEALQQAFGTDRKTRCALGTAKTNLGHLDAAAGVTGLIKTALMLERGEMPACLHYQKPNPKIDFAKGSFYVNADRTIWPDQPTPRRAGVSSFGIGGTNAHVVLEQAPDPLPSGPARDPQILVWSAKTASARSAAAHNLAAFLKDHADLNLADAAWTLQVGRKEFEHRGMAVCSSAAQGAERLSRGELRSGVAGGKPPEVVMMFSGQGSQYACMGRALYENETVYRDVVDQCLERLTGGCGVDLKPLLLGRQGNDELNALMTRTEAAQLGLFVTEYALAKLWESWGVKADAMIGHSLGEYVAATLCGVMTLDDVLPLVAARGRLMGKMPGGAMTAVSFTEKEACERLQDSGLSLAAVNGPGVVVISGSREDMTAFESSLQQESVGYRRLQTSHAFHSAMMDPVLEDFEREVAKITLHAPTGRFVSNLTGRWIQPEEATNPNYWVRHLRETVRFWDGVKELAGEENRVYLEVGPGKTLSQLARREIKGTGRSMVLGGLQSEGEARGVMESLGSLWLAGVAVNWEGVHAGERRRRIELPTYPFERKKYLVKKRPRDHGSLPSLEKKGDLADWFYVPSWTRSGPVSASCVSGASWLIFADEFGLGERLAARLEAQGQKVMLAVAGSQGVLEEDRRYSLDFEAPEDCEWLVTTLCQSGKLPDRMVYLGGVDRPESRKRGAVSFPAGMAGFAGLLQLAQALARHAGDHAVHLDVVTSRAQEIHGEEPLDPTRATLHGLCRVIPQEHPNLNCRSLDVEVPEGGSWSEDFLEAFAPALSAPPDSRPTAFRGRHRWVQTFQPIRLQAPSPDGIPRRLRRGGIYMITGGLGAVGMALAEYLAETVQAKLILVGRSFFPPRGQWVDWLESHDADEPTSRKIRRIRGWEQSGAEVLVGRADVSQSDSMEGVIEEGVRRFGGLHGVIHAAGQVKFTMMATLTSEDCEAHFKAKIGGLQVLGRLLANRSLDFCMVTSSLASILGGLGFSAYAAANAYLDLDVMARNRSGGFPWLGVNLDGWNFQGATRGDSDAQFKLLQWAMTPEEGVEAVARVLNAPFVRSVAVSTGDLPARLERWGQRESDAAEPAPGPEPIAGHQRPDFATEYVAPRNPIEASVADVWQDMLGVEKIGIHDNFFELGGHSLLATQIMSRLKETFMVDLPLATFFSAPTVNQFSQEMIRLESQPGRVEKVAHALQRIKQMPAAERRRRIRENRSREEPS